MASQRSRKANRMGRMVRGSTGVKATMALLVLAGVAAGGYALARGDQGLGGSSLQIDSSHLARAKSRAFDVTANATGELEAKNQLEIENPLDTRSTIEEIVDEGTYVEEGDLLVKLNTDELETKLREERLNVVSAQNNYDQAVGALAIQKSENASARDDAELQVELAELALERWRKGEVAKRREELRVNLENAQREHERLKQKKDKSDRLLEQGFTSQDEHDQLVINLARAKADLAIARLEQDIYENYQHPEDEKTKRSEVSKAKAKLERTIQQNEINLANKEAAVKTREEELRLRQERLAELEQQVDAATITAPRAGLVVYGTTLESNRWDDEQPFEVGTEVRPRELLIALPNVANMGASVQIHESLASRVKRGQPARVVVEAASLEFTGAVRSIGVLAERGGWGNRDSRQYTVKLDIDPDQSGLDEVKPSMRCDASIVLDEVPETLTVPIQAVFSDGPVHYVCVPGKEGLHRRPIQIGKRSDMYAEVVKGLSEGERVLVRDPEAGELDGDEWSDAELAEAGYTRNEVTGEISVVARAARADEAPGEDEPAGDEAHPDADGDDDDESRGQRMSQRDDAGSGDAG